MSILLTKLYRPIGLVLIVIMHSTTASASLDTSWPFMVSQFQLGSSTYSLRTSHAQLSTGVDYYKVDANEVGDFPKQESNRHPKKQVIHIVALDVKNFDGNIQIKKALGVETGVSKLQDIARHGRVLAALNGGFFVEHSKDGVVGEAAGVSVVAGKLHSEATDSRPAFVFYKKESTWLPSIFPNFDNVIKISGAGWSRYASGINRIAGRVRNCGVATRSQNAPTVHDITCNTNDDIVLYNRDFGANPADYCPAPYLLRQNPNLFSDPYFTAICLPADEKKLADNLGKNLSIQITYWSNSKPLKILRHKEFYAVNGGPTLVERGRRVERYGEEGWVLDTHQVHDDANINHTTWVLGHHPRTGVGITNSNILLLIAVDGRLPSHSTGLSIPEFSDLFLELGALEAMNLDGGGSTGMMVNGELVTNPSDKAGPRPIGEAILIQGTNGGSGSFIEEHSLSSQ